MMQQKNYVEPDAPYLWSYTCAICVSAAHMWCFVRLSVYVLMRFLDAWTSQYCRTFISFSQYLLGMILKTLCSIVWGWLVIRAGPMPLCFPELLAHFLSSTVLNVFSFLLCVVILALWFSNRLVSITLSRPCIVSLF